jgi:regulatory protein
MPTLQQEINDLLSNKEDHFSCPKTARKKAMDFLARREYGQLELIRKLTGKGYEPDVARSAVEKLTLDGLQDDLRFSKNFVQSRIHQGKGPVRIRLDLGQRGLEGTIVEQAIEASEADWSELAMRVRIKKFGNEQAANFAARAKQMSFLQYRGFEQQHIQAAVRRD